MKSQLIAYSTIYPLPLWFGRAIIILELRCHQYLLLANFNLYNITSVPKSLSELTGELQNILNSWGKLSDICQMWKLLAQSSLPLHHWDHAMFHFMTISFRETEFSILVIISIALVIISIMHRNVEEGIRWQCSIWF